MTAKKSDGPIVDWFSKLLTITIMICIWAVALAGTYKLIEWIVS